MSTRFVVKIPSEEGFTTTIANRVSKEWGAHIYIMNWLLYNKLPDDCPVIAIDNTQQGIETIGDIRAHRISQLGQKRAYRQRKHRMNNTKRG